MLNYTWEIKPQPSEEAVTSLSEAINISPVLASILVQRGVQTFEQAKTYFRPELSDLHDPFFMKDLDKAVNRISEAIQNGDKILVYGDYDVDGSTSVALFYGFFRKYTEQLDYYIPDRYSEGYGVSSQGIEYAKEKGVSVIVTIDCGIKAIDKIAKAKEYGIDVIICDHHRPGDVLPPAYAILDPKQKDCTYPYDELCGCGVAFKLIQGFCQQNSIDESEAFEFLDLVAVATCSDIVPITGENRVLVSMGLKQLNTNPRPGLKALIELGGFKNDLNVTNVVFGIGPRINAAGRIDHAHGAVKLLLAESTEAAHSFGVKVNEKNNLRRDFDSSITQEALRMIEEDEQLMQAKSTVLFKNDWHKNRIGIVASRFIENHYSPTIILTESNGKATGSARSVHGFDVYEAITSCADLLEQFGGHTYAAGLTMKMENVPAFQKRFEEIVSASITEEQLVPKISIDQVLTFDQITSKFFSVLTQMGPFGPQNMQPTFISENVVDNGKSRIVKDTHLKIGVKQNGVEINGIGFGLAHHYEQIRTGVPFHICYNLEENHFNGKTTLQLMVKDIRF